MGKYIAVIGLWVIVGCSNVHKSDLPYLAPLDSKIGFAVDVSWTLPPPSIWVATDQVYTANDSRLLGELEHDASQRTILIKLYGIEKRWAQREDLRSASKSWIVPDLQYGKYTLSFEIDYGGREPLKEVYMIEADYGKVVVTPSSRDSTHYGILLDYWGWP